LNRIYPVDGFATPIGSAVAKGYGGTGPAFRPIHVPSVTMFPGHSHGVSKHGDFFQTFYAKPWSQSAISSAYRLGVEHCSTAALTWPKGPRYAWPSGPGMLERHQGPMALCPIRIEMLETAIYRTQAFVQIS